VVWYGMVWYGMVWCGVVWYGVVWCGMVCDRIGSDGLRLGSDWGWDDNAMRDGGLLHDVARVDGVGQRAAHKVEAGERGRHTGSVLGACLRLLPTRTLPSHGDDSKAGLSAAAAAQRPAAVIRLAVRAEGQSS
jgi:hypothetical protein